MTHIYYGNKMKHDLCPSSKYGELIIIVKHQGQEIVANIMKEYYASQYINATMLEERILLRLRRMLANLLCSITYLIKSKVVSF